MSANRMNRDAFYAALAPHDDARLRKILWTLYWRGNAQLRERIEDELRPAEPPKVSQKNHTERSKWRLTFRRLAGDALTALQATEPAPAQQAVGKIVDLVGEMRGYDYFHSDDPVEAAKFVVSEAVAALWDSVLRQDGFRAFADRVPEQLIRWEADSGWTRRGYGQVADKETPLAVPLAHLLSTPDRWRTFAESYLETLDAAGRADRTRPRTGYGYLDEPAHRRRQRTGDLATWHGMLVERFAGTPEDELLDRLAASPALAGPGLTSLRTQIAGQRGGGSPGTARDAG